MFSLHIVGLVIVVVGCLSLKGDMGVWAFVFT